MSDRDATHWSTLIGHEKIERWFRSAIQSGRLAGSWALAGMERVWGQVFAIPLLPAAASELLITLPTHLRPVVEDGLVIPPDETPGGAPEWRVIPGSGPLARVTIEPRISNETEGRALVSATTSWSLAREGTSFRAQFVLQTIGTEATAFSIPLPRTISPESTASAPGAMASARRADGRS